MEFASRRDGLPPVPPAEPRVIAGSPRRSPWRRLAGLAAAAAIPLTFVALVVLFFPFRYVFEFDPDEGVNAMKAFLVQRGYRLYFDIWSDQPPVFTFLLAGWFRAFGASTLMGRLLVLTTSAGLLAVASSYLRRSWGFGAALVGLGLFVILPYFPQLSASMMIGLPSIALALGSFYALQRWHERQRPASLVVSALLLGLSIFTKLFTLVLVPVWLAGILLDIRRTPAAAPGRRRSWVPAAVWMGTLAVTGAAVALWGIGAGNLSQLLDVHLVSAARDVPAWNQMPEILTFLGPSLPLFLLAAIGVWRAARRGAWGALYLGGWILTGGVFLFLNHPAWYHHQLLVTVPAAILAAIAVASAFQDLVQWRRLPSAGQKLGTLLTLAFFLVTLDTHLPAALSRFDPRLPNFNPPQVVDEERQIVALMWNHAEETEWMFTDRPMFAFAIGRPVPPGLAVISEKRLVTGSLPDAEILATLEAYAPTMILEGQFVIPAVKTYMYPRNFARLDSALHYRLYLKPPVD